MVDAFLRHAAPDWRMGGGPLQVRHRHTAERILRRHPEIRHQNLFTRIVCGDLDGVERILAARPEAATEPGGPKQWPPLLYLCAGRLTLPDFREHAVAIGRALLDCGADPNVCFPGGSADIRYTALTCVVGQGEERAPLHPQAHALARLLLERGAEPYDTQVFYNISQGYLSDETIWLLDLIYEHSMRRGRASDWKDPEWSMIDMGGYGRGARFLLEPAVHGNHLELAKWLLAHGASPDAAPARDRRWSKTTLEHDAVTRGHTDMARLLVAYGATPGATPAEGEEAFVAACLNLDRTAARAEAAKHPEYLRSPRALHLAARLDRPDAIQLLVELGTPPDVPDAAKENQRALHVAAYAGAAAAARELVGRGATIDPVDDHHDATPLFFAMWGRQPRTIEVLAPLSRDLWALAAIGDVDRIRRVLAEEPERAAGRAESTPLFFLPDDEAAAKQIVELLLAHGADPSFRRKDGKTAADVARERCMDDIAEQLVAGSW